MPSIAGHISVSVRFTNWCFTKEVLKGYFHDHYFQTFRSYGRASYLFGSIVLSRDFRLGQTDPAVSTVQNFYDGLLASMKLGGAARARFDKLQPVIEKTFDLPGMTAVAVGPGWASLSPADQRR